MRVTPLVRNIGPDVCSTCRLRTLFYSLKYTHTNAMLSMIGADNEYTRMNTKLYRLLYEKKEIDNTLRQIAPVHSLRPRGDNGRVKPVLLKKKRYYERSQLPKEHPDHVHLTSERTVGVTWFAKQCKKGNVNLSESQRTALEKSQEIIKLQKELSRPEAKAAVAEARRKVYHFMLHTMVGDAGMLAYPPHMRDADLSAVADNAQPADAA